MGAQITEGLNISWAFSSLSLNQLSAKKQVPPLAKHRGRRKREKHERQPKGSERKTGFAFHVPSSGLYWLHHLRPGWLWTGDSNPDHQPHLGASDFLVCVFLMTEVAVRRATGVDLEVMLVTSPGLREQLIYLCVGTSTRNQQKLREWRRGNTWVFKSMNQALPFLSSQSWK